MEPQNNQQNPQIAVVMVPFPAQGHLNQFLHLSHRLTSFNIPVHYAGSSTHNRQAKLRLHGWDPDSLTRIHFHDFELPPYSLPSPDLSAGTQFPAHLQPLYDASLNLRQPVCRLLQELATQFRRVIVIHDIPIASVVQDVKSIPKAEAYAVLSISAFTMFFSIWESMDEKEKPFQLDSEVDFCHSLPSSEECVTQEIVEFMNYQNTFMDFQSGTIYNTCRVIEGKYIELLERQSMNQNSKHFAIGPFHPVEIRTGSDKQRQNGCLEWLDKQEENSVIYVSFGSSTTMSNDQIRELAEGLERSGQKFLWVLRNADIGDIFKEDEDKIPQLPEGYEDRVKNRGIVVRDWAPQIEILAHRSTGGFMSHCGWNSCLESISMGVPIAAWPMHSDQPMNTVLVTKVLGIGTMVKEWTGRADLVASSDIENSVTRLMASKEGLEMRKRAANLGEKVRYSTAKGGVSHLEMEFFIAHITR